ncbi:hypothetical protein MMC15_000157 [Xylographa vitiligo]|nr:hypothetical protein [Xylographa vitiligo]
MGNRTHYASAPAITSKRQLAGQSARIKQQPVKLEYSRSLYEAPSPVDLSEDASHASPKAPWTSKGPADRVIKEEHSQRQNNARDGFDTDVDDDFDDTTTMSHDIQLKDSQTHYNQSLEPYDGYGSAQEPNDIDSVRGIDTHVESHEMDYTGSIAAGTSGRFELSEGADYPEEVDSESDRSGEDGGAEDDPTLDSHRMNALLPPAVAQALERVNDAMQNTKYANQQFPIDSLRNDQLPLTSDHEDEDFDATDHLPYREVVYRPKSKSPGGFNVPSAVNARTGALPLQQSRHIYEADRQSASGIDVLQTKTLSQTSGRPLDESRYRPVLTAITTSVKPRASRPLQHQASMEVVRQPATTSQQDPHKIAHDQASVGGEQHQSIQSPKTPYRSQEWGSGRISVTSVSGANLNDNTSFSPTGQVVVDEKVLPLREDLSVDQLPHQPNVASAHGQKRIMDLDYTEDQLTEMSYDQLRSESFDFDPKDSVHIFPEEVRSGPLIKQFEFVKDLKDLTDEQRSKKLHSFFSSLTIDKYEECGDMVLELFLDILTKYKDARQEKRKIARKYEEEISRREQTVSGASLRVDNEMKRIRQAGNDLLKGSGAGP